MDFTHINAYLLVYSGTVALGVMMLALMLLCFLAVMSVVAVVYGLVHAVLGVVGAMKSRPVVSPGPAVLRHSSRTVVVLVPRTHGTQAISATSATVQTALSRAA